MSGYILWGVGLVLLSVPCFVLMARWIDHRDLLALGAFAVGVLLVVCGAIVAIAPSVSYKSCERKGEAMDREWRYGAFEGCLIRLADGRWVPLDAYRLADEDGAA